MSPKRMPAAIHSKKADKKGRTKDRRHGTQAWATWIEKDRMEPAGRAVRSRRR